MFVLSYETRLPWTPSNKVLFLDFRGKNKAVRTAVLPDTAEMELGGATATRCRQRRHSGLIYTTDINPVPHDCSTTQNTPARLLAHEERRSTGLVGTANPDSWSPDERRRFAHEDVLETGDSVTEL